MDRKSKQRPRAQPDERKPPDRAARKNTALRFTPTAWAKLLYFRDRQGCEIGGFGITPAEDLLLVEEFITVKQDVSVASVAFEDAAVADLFDVQVDAGRKPEQFARIWLHTHPGDSPAPSATDEETFARVFGKCQWAVMFILARKGRSYARLRFSVGPGGQIAIPVEVDYGQPFGPSDQETWEAEYRAHIDGTPDRMLAGSSFGATADDLAGLSCPDEWLEELEAMGPDERQVILDELAARPELWEGSEVMYGWQ